MPQNLDVQYLDVFHMELNQMSSNLFDVFHVNDKTETAFLLLQPESRPHNIDVNEGC